MASYAFATLQARQTLQELWEQGKTVKDMAAALDVPLSTVFGSRFQRTMHNIGEGAWIGGKCWVFPYYDQNGELAFQRFPADEVLPFWADADHTILDAAVHVYEVAGNLEATAMNSATAQACGDRKRRFSLVFMHSAPATNLENLNLLTALKYTDKEGVTRDLTLYTRQRKVFAPFGISYEKTSQTSLSPTDEELENGANWCLVHSGESDEGQRSYIAHKAIPIARILSRG